MCFVDNVIEKHANKPGFLLNVLEDIQNNHQNKYLPEDTLNLLSKKTQIPLSQIYSVVTFYAFFNLKPQGKHTIVVCRGTACHTRGSKVLLDSLINTLDFEEEEDISSSKIFLTTKDTKFTVKTVACFGQCALAPVVEIDGITYSYMNVDKLKKLVKSIMDTDTNEVKSGK